MAAIKKVVTYRIHIENNKVTTIKQMYNQREATIYIRRVPGYEGTFYIASTLKYNSRSFNKTVITQYMKHVLALMGSTAQITNETEFLIKK